MIDYTKNIETQLSAISEKILQDFGKVLKYVGISRSNGKKTTKQHQRERSK